MKKAFVIGSYDVSAIGSVNPDYAELTILVAHDFTEGGSFIPSQSIKICGEQSIIDLQKACEQTLKMKNLKELV